MDPVSVHPLMSGFLLSKSGKIETGREEKDEADRNKQSHFGFFHRFLRLERKGSDRHKTQIYLIFVRQYMHLAFEEEMIAEVEDASDRDVN